VEHSAIRLTQALSLLLLLSANACASSPGMNSCDDGKRMGFDCSAEFDIAVTELRATMTTLREREDLSDESRAHLDRIFEQANFAQDRFARKCNAYFTCEIDSQTLRDHTLGLGNAIKDALETTKRALGLSSEEADSEIRELRRRIIPAAQPLD